MNALRKHTARMCNISMLILISFHFSEAGVGQCIYSPLVYITRTPSGKQLLVNTIKFELLA